MKPACRFVLLTLGLAGALAGGLALLNYVVDPYNAFGNNRLGVYISADRECKSTYVRSYPHNALLLGNSRMAVIPPSRLNGFRFFNGAFAGATCEEVYYFAYHYAKKEELVILGVDLGMGDPSAPELKGDIFAPLGFNSVLSNLFNLQTVEYSFRTIFTHLGGTPSPMTPDGAFDMGGWIKNVDKEDPAYRNWQMERMKRGWEGFDDPSRGRLSYYVKLAECLRQRGITCVVVVPPMHEELARHLQASRAREAFEGWRRQMQSIFTNVVDLSFSDYGADKSFYRADPAHFKPEVGARMLNAEVIPVALQVLGRPPAERLAGAAAEVRNPKEN
jgi:hypothetical protein